MHEKGVFLPREIALDLVYFCVAGIVLICAVLLAIGTINLEESKTPEQKIKSFKNQESKLKKKEKELKGLEKKLKITS